jgi:hypothetical protein
MARSARPTAHHANPTPLPRHHPRTVQIEAAQRAIAPASSPLARRAGAAGSAAVAARHTEIDLSAVIGRLCAHALEGYLEPYKREVIGILLGRAGPGRRIRCVETAAYAARARARTRCDPNPEALRRRARALAARTGLEFLGCYHSHPEEAGSRAWALSPEDREIFYAERSARLEVVVSVAEAGARARASTPAPRRNKDGSISLWAGDWHFRLSAEAKG